MVGFAGFKTTLKRQLVYGELCADEELMEMASSWIRRHGRSVVKRMKELEDENRRLKQVRWKELHIWNSCRGN